MESDQKLWIEKTHKDIEYWHMNKQSYRGKPNISFLVKLRRFKEHKRKQANKDSDEDSRNQMFKFQTLASK